MNESNRWSDTGPTTCRQLTGTLDQVNLTTSSISVLAVKPIPLVQPLRKRYIEISGSSVSVRIVSNRQLSNSAVHSHHFEVISLPCKLWGYRHDERQSSPQWVHTGERTVCMPYPALLKEQEQDKLIMR